MLPISLTIIKNDHITYIHCAKQFLLIIISSRKTADTPIEPYEIQSYCVPTANINDVKPNSNITVLKNELGEMPRCIEET